MQLLGSILTEKRDVTALPSLLLPKWNADVVAGAQRAMLDQQVKATYWGGWRNKTAKGRILFRININHGNTNTELNFLDSYPEIFLLYHTTSKQRWGVRILTKSFMHAQLLSHVGFSETLWTIAFQSPLSMDFSRQEHWSGLPCPPPGDLPDPGVKPPSPAPPALACRFFTTGPPGKPLEWPIKAVPDLI